MPHTVFPVIDIDGLAVMEFESVNALIECAFARGQGNGSHGAIKADDIMMQVDSWTDGKCYTDVQDAMRVAPTDLLREVHRVRAAIEDKIEPPVRKRRTRRQRQPQGDELNAEAWIQRDPEGWIDIQHRRVYKHVVSIGVNLVTPCTFDQSKLTYRGALVAALTDCFTTLGHSVHVDLVYTSLNTCSAWRKTVVVCTVKHSDSPLDIASLTYTTGSIAFSRLGVLCAEIRCCQGEIDCGCGSPAAIPKSMRDRYDIVFDLDILDFDRAVERATLELEEIQKKDARFTINKR